MRVERLPTSKPTSEPSAYAVTPARGQPAPYEIRYSPAAASTITVLPQTAKRALRNALRQVAADPMTGAPYHPRWPAEIRTIPFGETGLLAYIVLRRRQEVVIEQVTCAD
jgi:hypothetical protein